MSDDNKDATSTSAADDSTERLEIDAPTPSEGAKSPTTADNDEETNDQAPPVEEPAMKENDDSASQSADAEKVDRNGEPEKEKEGAADEPADQAEEKTIDDDPEGESELTEQLLEREKEADVITLDDEAKNIDVPAPVVPDSTTVTHDGEVPKYKPKTLVWFLNPKVPSKLNRSMRAMPAVVINEVRLEEVKAKSDDESWILSFSTGSVTLEKNEKIFDFCHYFSRCYPYMEAPDDQKEEALAAKCKEACRLVIEMTRLSAQKAAKEKAGKEGESAEGVVDTASDALDFAMAHLSSLENIKVSDQFYEKVIVGKVRIYIEKALRKRVSQEIVVKAKKSRPSASSVATPKASKSKPPAPAATPRSVVRTPKGGPVDEEKLKEPLDNGWHRDLAKRKTTRDGQPPKKFGDIYYRPPDSWRAKKCRSNNDVQATLEQNSGKFPEYWLDNVAAYFSYRDTIELDHPNQHVQ